MPFCAVRVVCPHEQTPRAENERRTCLVGKMERVQISRRRYPAISYDEYIPNVEFDKHCSLVSDEDPKHSHLESECKRDSVISHSFHNPHLLCHVQQGEISPSSSMRDYKSRILNHRRGKKEMWVHSPLPHHKLANSLYLIGCLASARRSRNSDCQRRYTDEKSKFND